MILFDAYLPRRAHRTEPEVRMTINLMVAHFEGTLDTLAPKG